MNAYLNKSGNNIFFWSKGRKEDSYASAVLEATTALPTVPNGEFVVGDVVRQGAERFEIKSITAL